MVKRIKWKYSEDEKDDPMYYASNGKGEFLGYLEYERVGRFKHWCWYQYRDIRMSPGCLQEVRDKQKELHSYYSKEAKK